MNNITQEIMSGIRVMLLAAFAKGLFRPELREMLDFPKGVESIDQQVSAIWNQLEENPEDAVDDLLYGVTSLSQNPDLADKAMIMYLNIAGNKGYLTDLEEVVAIELADALSLDFEDYLKEFRSE